MGSIQDQRSLNVSKRGGREVRRVKRDSERLTGEQVGKRGLRRD